MKQISHRFLALVLVFTLLFAGRAAPAGGQAYSAPEMAFQEALDAYNTAYQTDFSFVLSAQAGGLAYASALPGAPEIHSDPLVMLAFENGGQGWVVLTPGKSAAEEYNRLLDSFSDTLIDPQTRAMLRLPDAPPAGPALMLANYSGHRLPWPYGQAGYVTQKDTSYHMYQIDFDIRGRAANGDVYASKPGTVVFVKDSSTTICQTPAPDPCWKKSNMVVVQHDSGEYTWYLHIAYNSAAVSTGQRVGYGTKLAVEGETGYSFGVHLHFMASSGHTSWTDPSDANNAPWGTGITTQVDFDEYSWPALVVSYSSTYTSQNGASLAPTCPRAGGLLLYRDSNYRCAGLLENFGYAFHGSVGFQNLSASFNDMASSAQVPSGRSVMLYENPDRSGGKKCLNAADSNFSDDVFDNNVALNDHVSSFEVFSAPGCPSRTPADLTAPTGSITSPANGADVGRTVMLSANASDSTSGVQMVRFHAEWGSETRLIFTDASAPYSYEWDLCAAGIPDGPVTISANVIDRAWNTFTSPTQTFNKQYDCTAAPAGSWTAGYWASPTPSGAPLVQGEINSPFLFMDWGSGAAGETLPVDGWSARFTRAFNFGGGTYRFHCQSAGGCRLFVDGLERVSGWQASSPSGYEWSGPVSAGSHEIKVEYFDNGTTGAMLEVWWEGPGFLNTPQACTDGSWCASYWGNPGMTGAPVITRSEGEALNHSWGQQGPDPLLPALRFSTRASRTAEFACGTYQFQLDTSGAARLWVNDVLLIDLWNGAGGPASGTAEVDLERGQHALRVEHIGAGESASLQVDWQKVQNCPVSAAVQAASSHVVRPGAVIEPAVSMLVKAGYLDPARGDGLKFISGSLLGAQPEQRARSVVECEQSYVFDPANGFRMTAPTASGSYTSQWAVTANGEVISPNASIHVTVDGSAPQMSITSPGSMVNTGPLQLKAGISDPHSSVTHAQFLAGYNDSSGWAWRSLGYDLTGSDGWSFSWGAAGVPDQKGVSLMVAAWDGAGNKAEALVENVTLDRTAPLAAVAPIAPSQESTRFKVSWSGSDTLTGVHHYDLRVMVDGGTAQSWLSNVPAKTQTAWFVGELGRRYTFQVRAVDGAGNASAFSSPSPSTLITPCTPDDSEPDSSPAQAKTITVDSALQGHNFCQANDVDWYVIEASAGTHYMISTTAQGATSDTLLTLYAADGTTVLGENDNANSSTTGSLLHWTPTTSSPLYFSIRSADPRIAGNAVTYAARVAEARMQWVPVILK